MAWCERLRRRAAGWAGPGLDLLCPPRCGVCGAEPPVEGDEGAGGGVAGVCVCPRCRRSLVDDDLRCPDCGSSCPAGACAACQRGAPPCAGLVVLGGYGDELRTAVLRAKRPGAEPVAAALGGLLVRRHRTTLAAWDCDVVVPVPMHWIRRTLRGTSAAEEIARQVAAELRLPCRRLLRRIRATRMQNELPFEDRRGNVRGAFRGRPGAAGRRILLVDDVVTTGGTLAECSRALAAAGAAAVHAAAAARAERVADARDDHG
jgi:ComF family protein